MDFMQNIDQSFEGFSEMNMQSLQELHKALQAGSGTDAGSFTGGRALIPESLDNTLVNILHSQDEAIIFKALKKKSINSPVHQWDVRDEVGADDGAWVPEGGKSEEADQSIERKYATAKYLQTLRKVTLQASIANTIEPAMALEQNAGTLWLVRNVERGIIYGNSNFVPEQPDGLISQIPSSNVIDMRGADATSAEFENKVVESMRIIRENYGKGSLLTGSPTMMQDVSALMRDRLRFQTNDGRMAAVPQTYPTPFGEVNLKENIFIQEGGEPTASVLSDKRPSAPTINSASAGSSSDSYFASGDAGDYQYKVVAVNRYGDSPASSASSTVSVTAGQEVSIAVAKPTETVTAYKVYRTAKGSTDSFRYAFTVAYSADPQTIVDNNSDLPGTGDAFILTMDGMYDAIEWFQFLPMMKFPLYPTNEAVYPFLMLLFGSLALKKPVQHIRLKNLSPSTLSWF